MQILATWKAPVSIDRDDISINNFWLLNTDIYVTHFNRTPVSELQSYNNPWSNWKGFLSHFTRGWTITLNLKIKGPTPELFMEKLNNFYWEIYKENSVLRFKINWLDRQVKVNCISSPLDFIHINITSIDLTIWFEYLDNIEWLTKQTLTLKDKIWNFTQEISNKWNSITPLFIYHIFKENTTLTEVKITNGEDYIQIINNFTEWDVLYIDWIEKEVYKNWSIIDYDMVTLNLNTWSNRIKFEYIWNFKADVFILNDKKYK